jgi:hypothetical protein
MEEENPVEQATEDVHHAATHTREPWISAVALSTALLAALAAVSSSMSTHHESEGVLSLITSSDRWAYYQAKGIKQDILKATHPDSPEIARYAQDQQKIAVEAGEFQGESDRHMRLHRIYANAVMFSQIAIAVAAISVLARRPSFWLVSLGFGAVGLFFLIKGSVVR